MKAIYHERTETAHTITYTAVDRWNQTFNRQTILNTDREINDIYTLRFIKNFINALSIAEGFRYANIKEIRKDG